MRFFEQNLQRKRYGAIYGETYFGSNEVRNPSTGQRFSRRILRNEEKVCGFATVTAW